MHHWIHCYIFFSSFIVVQGYNKPNAYIATQGTCSLHVFLFIGVYASNARKLWHNGEGSYPQTLPTRRVCSPLNSSSLRARTFLARCRFTISSCKLCITREFLLKLQLCFNEMSSFTLKIGPVPPAFDDFWRMVWEKQSATIIMLTNLQERHQVSEAFSCIKQKSIEVCL